ncbi:MAG: GyrI-like domain-containing protein [Opitutaceae bacterium]|nr:GyrI-like domain-containing protein [Cytophagales bacterium]
MFPQIENLGEKKLIGMRLAMSLADNKTAELWRRFMPRRKEIKNNISNNIISMQVYEPTYFASFNPTKMSVKWATVEVHTFDNVPEGLDTFILPGGLYAVFNYIGLNTDNSIFQYIFGTWFPNSIYDLADRPHFELLGEKHKNNDENSEEEIWIPIQPRKC